MPTAKCCQVGGELNGMFVSCLLWSAFMDDLGEFVLFDLFKCFPASIQGFKGLHQGFRHSRMSLFRATHDRELIGLSDPFMTVLIVQSKAY